MLMYNAYSSQKMGSGKGSSSVNKGVGGYRPTVNWREISIRKKNVADKQVLACIVISGILIIVIGIIVTILGFLVISSQCPFMWEKGHESCYYLAQHNASWSDGQAYCQGQAGNLLDLHSLSEADFILGKMQGQSWLGLQRDKGKSEWTWVSGSKLNYTRWQDPSVLAGTATTKECVMIETTGGWSVAGCDDDYYVICDFVPGYNPFVLIGPVVILCGCVVLILSIEVCIRRREFIEKNPEVVVSDDDDSRQAEEEDAGLDNPGFSGATTTAATTSATTTTTTTTKVDPGIINYGYGNFEDEGDDVDDDKTKTVKWAPLESSSPAKVASSSPENSAPGSSGVTTLVAEAECEGPRVHVVPASLPNSPGMNTQPAEETTHSQEQLELLLSPKTLQ